MEHTFLLPQYAESLIPQHVQQFQDGMKEVRSIWDVLGEWADRVYKAFIGIITPIAKTILEIFVPPVKRTRLSKQSRHYLSIKHRAVLRMQRHGRTT